MAKPQAVTIPSDDCLVNIDGVRYALHEGETVTLIHGMSVGAMTSLNAMLQIGPKLAAADGEPDEKLQHARLADDAMQALCAALAPRLVAWTWTDVAGRPLPQPDGTTGPLMALDPAEIGWLVMAAKGETAGARKNG